MFKTSNKWRRFILPDAATYCILTFCCHCNLAGAACVPTARQKSGSFLRDAYQLILQFRASRSEMGERYFRITTLMDTKIEPGPARGEAIFRGLCISVLLVTALAKAIGLFNGPRLLHEPDRIFPLSVGTMMAIGMIAEFSVAFLILRSSIRRSAISVILFFLILTVYRISTKALGGHCSCLGTLSDWWGWLRNNESTVLNTIVVWLIGSSLLVLYRIRESDGHAH